MESSRVVEVLHDQGAGVARRWLRGSGFIVKSGVALTAAHNLGAPPGDASKARTYVRTLDGAEHLTTVVVRSDLLDLALLGVAECLTQPAVPVGRIGRDHIGVVRDVMAVGFPNFKEVKTRPKVTRRQPAQPVGSIPTVEDLTAKQLTLKVEAGLPAARPDKDRSTWEGLSGAAVVVGAHLIGVVVAHRPAEGLGSLQIVPLSRLAELADPDRAIFNALLGIDDVAAIPTINQEPSIESEPSPDLVRDLEELLKLKEMGLLGLGDLQSLRITAVKEAKGWK